MQTFQEKALQSHDCPVILSGDSGMFMLHSA